MSYKVMFVDHAEQDLRSTYGYIAAEFSDVLARKVYAEIRDTILLLEDNTALGHAIPQLSKLGMTDYRQLVIGKRNKVIYQIDAAEKHIYIHLICNARQDFDAALARRMLEI